ncbi:hypothetical protein L7F22_024616 [Adiantum nelumboides]|nr:hypothetical protein [Adiantum nelumboides]
MGGEVKKLEVKVPMKHPASLVWKTWIHEVESLPSLLPGHFDTIQHTHGPPLTPGSIFEASYSEDVSHYNFLKARWDEIDHQNFSFKATIIDGGALGKHFNHLCYLLNVVPGNDPNTCLLDCAVEYEDIGDHTFHDFIKEEIEKVANTINAHLSSL